MPQYLLTCRCGEDVRVELSQAGQSVVCAKCGESVDVPTMREIKTLPAAQDDDASPAAPAWSQRQGMLFVVGVVATVIGLALSGYFLMQRMKLTTTKPAIADGSRFDAGLETTPIDRLHDLWQLIENRGLPPRQRPQYLIHRQQARLWELALAGGVIVVLVGAGCLAAAFVLKPKE